MSDSAESDEFVSFSERSTAINELDREAVTVLGEAYEYNGLPFRYFIKSDLRNGVSSVNPFDGFTEPQQFTVEQLRELSEFDVWITNKIISGKLPNISSHDDPLTPRWYNKLRSKLYYSEVTSAVLSVEESWEDVPGCVWMDDEECEDGGYWWPHPLGYFIDDAAFHVIEEVEEPIAEAIENGRTGNKHIFRHYLYTHLNEGSNKVRRLSPDYSDGAATWVSENDIREFAVINVEKLAEQVAQTNINAERLAS